MASIKDLKRMCKNHEECDGCPLFCQGFSRCNPYELPDNADEIIDKWVAEHPVKTYAMDFFEKFPNASRHCDGSPKVCWNNVYGKGRICPFNTCIECWNQEMKEDG